MQEYKANHLINGIIIINIIIKYLMQKKKILTINIGDGFGIGWYVS